MGLIVSKAAVVSIHANTAWHGHGADRYLSDEGRQSRWELICREKSVSGSASNSFADSHGSGTVISFLVISEALSALRPLTILAAERGFITARISAAVCTSSLLRALAA